MLNIWERKMEYLPTTRFLHAARQWRWVKPIHMWTKQFFKKEYLKNALILFNQSFKQFNVYLIFNNPSIFILLYNFLTELFPVLYPNGVAIVALLIRNCLKIQLFNNYSWNMFVDYPTCFLKLKQRFKYTFYII